MAEKPEVRYAVRRDWYIDGRWYPYSIVGDRRYRWHNEMSHQDGYDTQAEAFAVLERTVAQHKADSERILPILEQLRKEENSG